MSARTPDGVYLLGLPELDLARLRTVIRTITKTWLSISGVLLPILFKGKEHADLFLSAIQLMLTFSRKVSASGPCALHCPFAAPHAECKAIYFTAMSVRTLQRTDGAVFFCTFTCYAWLRLIEITALRDRLYNWMHIAHGKGFRILGFVIMPNHAHLLIHAPEGSSINKLMGNGKRFLAYDVVARLKAKGELSLLNTLRSAVRPSDAARGQSHRVFATSTDISECFDRAMIEQKLDYMHANPVDGVWSLVDDALDYPHSSAAFYDRGDPCLAPITHYHEIIG